MSFKLANADGRAVLVLGDRIADVEESSGGKFAADPMAVLSSWDAFAGWANGVSAGAATGALNESTLGACVPRPTKVFGIGMNYREHAKEAGMEIPGSPVVFTKFPSCLTGPRANVELSSDFVDWEVELVVVIGRRGRRIAESQALAHVAGCCVGQDISDRKVQFRDKPPQFSIGKSYDSFGPIGPWLTSIDGIKNADDLALTCDVAGERMQSARTSDMIFSVAQLIAFLSNACTLEPGDLIFTGTPSGVGSTRDPRRYLRKGEEIVSEIEGLGTLKNRCV